MALQKETTHIQSDDAYLWEYYFNGNSWCIYEVDNWKLIPFSDEWVAKNLTPIANLEEAQPTSEQDPNGIGQHDSGAKLDAGKPMAGRLLGMFGGALMAVSEVGTFGAKKYTEGGWQHVEDGFKRYDDAGMRHFLKRGMGEEFDADSELPHLAHEAWNALAKLELYLRDKKQS